MADRQEPARRAAERRSSSERQTAPIRRSGAEQRSSSERQAAPIRRSGSEQQRQSTNRRSDVVRCENCGEDYSITYKRCPFCDERSGRGGYGGGKRVSNTRGGGYGGPANPLQIAVLIISLILIIAAMFIVFRFFSSAIFGGKQGGDNSSASGSGAGTSQSTGSSSSGQGQGGTSQPGGDVSTPDTSTGDNSQPSTQIIAPQSIKLNKTDMTLRPNEIFQMVATVSPAGVTAPVTWSTSNPNVASIDENGLVTNRNSGSSKVSATITATCGDVTAECIVRCNPQGGSAASPGNTTTPGSTTTSSGTGNQTGTVAANSRGTIINAENGLNIRSGPGRDYGVIASASNGSSVTILGEENGWYKITYNGSSTGYVSKDYVSVGN